MRSHPARRPFGLVAGARVVSAASTVTKTELLLAFTVRDTHHNSAYGFDRSTLPPAAATREATCETTLTSEASHSGKTNWKKMDDEI